MKRFVGIAAIAAVAIALPGCSRAISNMQTLVSDDCGTTWRAIPVGNTVPPRVAPCALKVTIPNYPMTGDANFRVNFQNRVIVSVSTSYEYTITDPLLFIRNARYIGRQNSDGDGESNATSQYETAENILIDRRIREAASEMLRNEDIVIFDQGEFEDRLLIRMNELLRQRGVQLNSLAFVPTPDAQTRMAIDVAAADRVYEATGMREVGRELMIARASAPTIIVEQRAPSEPQPAE